MLKHRSADICFVQETGFMGKSIRIISRKATECKLFCIRNEKVLGGKGIC